MQITRNNLDTSPGPSDWFTGSVFVDTVAAPSEGSQIGWGEHVTDDEYRQAPDVTEVSR